ncbi:MAG: molybdenum cofactor biosynthesis protein [Bacteroidetes bacterium QS_9_68_14]|nr:MAG: molybdenum cofactor biosynthesis protein [Bacteroidetes bacterium QS_9_68_14]
MSHAEHPARAASFREQPIRCAIVTVSDTRTEETDRSGSLTRKRLRKAGHEVALYKIVPDEPDVIRRGIEQMAGSGEVDVALFSGGTGISRRDRTYDVLSEALDRKLPGFGELFRMRSYEEIGVGAMRSRAIGGVAGGTLFFSMPEALSAVKLALDELILPELAPLVWETVRQEEGAA